MFTVNRSSLRDTTIRRDYQFTTDHKKSYLTPLSDRDPDASSNSNTNTNATVDAAIDAAQTSEVYEPVDNLDFDIEDDLYSTSDIDSPSLTTQSQDPSIDLLNSISQTQSLPLIQLRPDITAQSWVFEHFSDVVIKGRLYTPKIGSKPRTNRRRCCKHCSFKSLNSKRHGTSSLITHLAKHDITKAHGPRTTSIANLIIRPPAPRKPKLSPEQSIVN